ncbi:MAG: lipopolysaccharide kinase InaA family protein [Planctomycetota bacterium]|jgi:heptose I phosphotransferase|nr:lipopolysaccharide kinase InaA family protein [Planctomycetota bacterium]
MAFARDPEKYKKDISATVSLDQGKVLACESDLAKLTELGLDTLEGAMAFKSDDIARSAGPRITYRVDVGHEVWYVKIHKTVPWRSKLALAGPLTVSPGHREWDSANMLRRSGFDVPQPVAFGESINFFSCPLRSFIITRGIEGPSLEEYLADGYPIMEGLSPHEVKNSILEDIAGMVKRFHSAGYYHKDLYCCHLIVAEDEHEKESRWGQPHIIDLERVVRERNPAERWIVKDLAALHFSAPAVVSMRDKWRFLKYYFPSWSYANRRRFAQKIEAKRKKIASHTPKY